MKLIYTGILMIIIMLNIAHATYTPPNYWDVDLELEPSYTAPNYWEVDLVLNEVSGLTITIVNPTNTTYDTTSVNLNWTNSTETDWVGYSLNGASNVTITEDLVMTAVEGSNHVIVWGNDTNGVMTSDEEWFTVLTSVPVINNLNDNSGIYAPNKNWVMWANVTDENADIDTVFLEFGGVNYTCTNNTIANYTYTISDLGVGSYTYKFYANNSYGSIENSTEGTLSITQATGIATLSLDPSNSIIYGTSITSKCEANTNEVLPVLYRNNVDVTATENDSAITLGVNTYDYECNFSATQNYTTSSDTDTLTISKADTSIKVYLNGTDGSITVAQGNVNITVILNVSDKTVSYYKNSSFMQSGTTPLENISSWMFYEDYNISGIFDGDTNYSGSQTDVVLTISDTIKPTITIESPTNTSYTTAFIDLKWSADEVIDWIAYSLNDGSNTSLTTMCYQETANTATDCGGLDTGIAWQSGTCTAPTNINDTDWNTYTQSSSPGSPCMGYVNYAKPDNAQSSSLWQVKDTQATYNFSIHSDCWNRGNTLEFRSYAYTLDDPSRVIWQCRKVSGAWQTLRTWDGIMVSMYEEAMWWNISGEYNITITAQEGSNNIILYGNDSTGNMNQTTVYFTVDSILPIIDIESPENKTYVSNSVWFNVSLNEVGSWCGYSLNGAQNITMTNSSGNWNNQNSSMTESYHTVIFYCNDTIGNMNQTTELGFTVNTTLTIELYLNGTSEDRYYEQGTYANLTGKILDANRDISIGNIWLDIDILGYGNNYITSATGIVQYDFETHAIKDEMINYDSVSDFEGEEQCCGSFVYDGWDFSVGEGGVVASALATHGSNIVSIDRYLPPYYGGISKNTTTEYMLFDIVYCADNVNVVVYSDYLVVYNKSCSVERNINVDLGTMGVNKLVNITSEGLGNWVPTFGFDYVRLFNDEITSYEFTVDVLERTTKHVGWSLNVYDDIDSIEFNLTGTLGPSVAGNDPVSRVGSQGTSLSIIDRNNPITTDGNLTRYEFYTPSSGKFNFKVYRNNGTHFIVINETGNINFLTGFNSFTTFMTVLEGDLIGGYLYPTGGSAIDVLYTGSSAWATGDKGTDLISNWNNADDALTFSLIAYTNNNETYPSNISIDVNQDGLDIYYPLAELKGENKFYLNKLSTGDTSKNFSYILPETKTFNIPMPTSDFDLDRFTFNITGHKSIIERDTIYTSVTNASVHNLTGITWAIDLNVTDDIIAGTVLTIEHQMNDGASVHPAKIYNITDGADNDASIIEDGDKWSVCTNLKQHNSTHFNWTIPELHSGESYRILMGKNVTWDNTTDARNITIKTTSQVFSAILKVSADEVVDRYWATDMTAAGTEIVRDCYHPPPESPTYTCNAQYSNVANFYDGNWGTYLHFGAYGVDHDQALGYVYSSITVSNYSGISEIAMTTETKPKAGSNPYEHDITVSQYVYKYTGTGSGYYYGCGSGSNYGDPSIDVNYTATCTIDSGLGLYSSGLIKTRHNNWAYRYDRTSATGYMSSFYLDVGRVPVSPTITHYTSNVEVWSNDGRVDSATDSIEMSQILIVGDNLMTFTNDEYFGTLYMYIEPMWESTPSNITLRYGDSITSLYENTTTFNTSIEINISDSTGIDTYISNNCANDAYCDIPFYLNTQTTGLLEISNINVSYSYNTIILDPLDITSGTPVIDLVYYDSNITIDDLNVTYYGSKNITVTAHNADYSINNSQDMRVVFSNYSIVRAFPWIIFRIGPNTTSEQPYKQNWNTHIINMSPLGYDPMNSNLSIALNESLDSCMNITISTTHNKADGVLLDDYVYPTWLDLYQLPTRGGDSKGFSLWIDTLNCNQSTYRWFNPIVGYNACCEECVRCW